MKRIIFISKYRILAFLPVIALTLFFACCSSNKTDHKATKAKSTTKKSKKEFSIIVPTKNQTIRFGDTFGIRIKSKNTEIDSISATFDSEKLRVAKQSEPGLFRCQGLPNKSGTQVIRFTIFYNDSLTENHQVQVLHIPNKEPQKIDYEIVRSFPHDPEAYTQGLLYKDGKLYESTGQPNRSSLRELDLTTGNVIRKENIDPQYFGEGIAMVKNEIFMLTYRAQVGFVFDPDNFEVKRQFNLQTGEGWGISTYNDTLLLTDGSSNLYFFLPDDYFTLVNQIEVCNDKGLVDNLNELEYTPMGLFSNVYGQDLIYIIDIRQGIVTHVLNLEDLFPKGVTRDMDHVLNGIAYNPDSNTFYITGKLWPIMYEIKLLFN